MNKENLMITLNNLVSVHASYGNDTLAEDLDYDEKIHELISDIEDYLIESDQRVRD